MSTPSEQHATRSVTPTGLIPILATPFDASGDVDLDSLRRLVEFELAAGSDGLAVHGLASEGFALTGDERSRVLHCVCDVAGQDTPIVAGVNGTGVRPALEQARGAAHDGADQVMVLPPYLIRPSAAQLVDFYGAVADGAGVPVMVQDAPTFTGVEMDADTIRQLADLDGVTSIKIEAPPTPPKMAALADCGLTVLGGGNAQALIEEYDNGSAGTMPACEFTDALRPVLDALAGTDDPAARTDARAGFARLLPLILLGVRESEAWAVHKRVLLRRGIIATETVRLPAGPLADVTARAVDEVLDDLALPRWDA